MAQGSPILECGECPVSSLQSNIVLWKVSGELMGAQY